jgi:type I restriction enzyme S subunit
MESFPVKEKGGSGKTRDRLPTENSQSVPETCGETGDLSIVDKGGVVRGAVKAGWETKKLGALYQVGSSKRVLKSQWKTEGVPFYRGREVTRLAANGFVDNELFISEEHFAQLAKQTGVPQTGDIVLTAIGTIGNSHIVRDRDRFYFKDASVLWMKRNSDVSSEFVNLWLKSPHFFDQLDRGNGATVDTLTIQKLQSVEVLLPPLTEQQRIVGVLDEAFANLAIAKANAEKNLQNARALFESHLQSAFTHRGEGWVRKKVSEISTHSLGKMLDKAKNKGKLKPYLRNLNVRWFSFDLSDMMEMRFLPEEEAKYTAAKGDVLICEGGYPGRAAIWENDEPVYFQKALHRVRFHEPEHNKWFVYYLYAQDQSGELKMHFNGAGIQHFTGEGLAKFEVPLPPLPELRKAVAKCDALAAETQRLAAITERKLAALEALKKSLLHQAFSGELTRKWRESKIIPFPVAVEGIKTTDMHVGILAMAYRLHEQHGKQSDFGHVKAEKIAHMVEAFVGIDLGREPVQDAAGPNDFNHLKKVEHRARKAGFFDFMRSEGRGPYRVKKLTRFDEAADRAEKALGDRKDEVLRLLEIMTRMEWKKAEIFATTFAAWNNLLLDGKPISDEAIVLAARENWHPDKLEIPRERFFNAIKWMRDQGFVPQGRGKRVIPKAG